MYSYRYGGKDGSVYNLEISETRIVVRTWGIERLMDAVKGESGLELLNKFSPVVEFPEANVFVLQGQGRQTELTSLRNAARETLKREDNIRFAGRLLQDSASGAPAVYTENFFVKFKGGLYKRDCKAILKEYELTVKRSLDFAENAFFIEAVEGTGLHRVFEIARTFLAEKEVELCHPELIRPPKQRDVGKYQWHLKPTKINGVEINAHVNVEAAWESTKGKGVTIAIIDDGIDIDHEELKGRIVHPRDVTLNKTDPRPKRTHPNPRYSDNHGTACAGVACAAGKYQASGVAPEATLMPIRLVSGLGSLAEADAIYWAAKHGADVISCSWGPEDGEWSNPNDVRHQQKFPLPDSTRLAIDYALTKGRKGKGCVITWAAGNGNENIENDGYAAYEPIIAVAACNDSNKRSIYSDFGDSVWCCFPSNDIEWAPFNHPAPKTSGIWTTDRSGDVGYNPNILDPFAPAGDVEGNYVTTFGGTSSACPGVAGITALILSANPKLHHRQVKKILRLAAEKIDLEGGSYDITGHSPWYGYGRPDAGRAVQLAFVTKTGQIEVAAAAISAESEPTEPMLLEPVPPETVVFQALTFRLASTVLEPSVEIANRVMQEVTGNRVWIVNQVERPMPAAPIIFDAVYHGQETITSGEAWGLTRKLRAHEAVESAEPGFIVPMEGVFEQGEREIGALAQERAYIPQVWASHLSVTEDKYRWSLEQIGAEEAWALTPSSGGKRKGEGIRIGHPDSGYKRHHELDQDRINTDLAKDYWEGDSDPEVKPPKTGGDHGLGTASVFMSGELGKVAGSAPLAELLPLRVAKSWPILTFSQTALRDAIYSAVANGCQVISISLGGLPNDEVHAAIKVAVSNGVIVLAAAGNVWPWVVYPAAYDEVIAVAACNIERKPFFYSSRGSQVDVTAPGESVWKAVKISGTEDVKRGKGTSFAVATVAGVAALWLAHHGYDNLESRYTKQNIVAVFRDMMINHGCLVSQYLDPGKFGAGIINAEKLLKALLPATAPPRRVATTPSGVNPVAAKMFRQLMNLFEDVPVETLKAKLVELLDTDEQQLPDILSQVGEELAFHFMIDPQLRATFEAAATGEPEAATSTRFLSTPASLYSVCDRLHAYELSTQLNQALSQG